MPILLMVTLGHETSRRTEVGESGQRGGLCPPLCLGEPLGTLQTKYCRWTPPVAVHQQTAEAALAGALVWGQAYMHTSTLS